MSEGKHELEVLSDEQRGAIRIRVMRGDLGIYIRATVTGNAELHFPEKLYAQMDAQTIEGEKYKLVLAIRAACEELIKDITS